MAAESESDEDAYFTAMMSQASLLPGANDSVATAFIATAGAGDDGDSAWCDAMVASSDASVVKEEDDEVWQRLMRWHNLEERLSSAAAVTPQRCSSELEADVLLAFLGRAMGAEA